MGLFELQRVNHRAEVLRVGVSTGWIANLISKSDYIKHSSDTQVVKSAT